MSQTHPLSNDDQIVIAQFNHAYNEILITLDRAKQFKLNDYLILFLSEGKSSPFTVQKNSYGAPVKYRVVHINDAGVGFIKRTNKKGEPIGRIYSLCGTEADDYRRIHQNFKFELDPDYADAILLQDKYDPAILHKSKKDIWKAVTEHNKTCKIPTGNLKDVTDFFNTVNPGDILWTSSIGHYVVQDKKTMSPADFNNIKPRFGFHTRMRGPFVLVLTVLDKKGKSRDITADFFLKKALYKERPRSYKELNI